MSSLPPIDSAAVYESNISLPEISLQSVGPHSMIEVTGGPTNLSNPKIHDQLKLKMPKLRLSNISLKKKREPNLSVHLTPVKLVPGPVGLTPVRSAVKINGAKVGYLPYMNKVNSKKKIKSEDLPKPIQPVI